MVLAQGKACVNKQRRLGLVKRGTSQPDEKLEEDITEPICMIWPKRRWNAFLRERNTRD